MSTAESLIKEYLDRGCSLDALRLLAESRPHPLAGEMLTIIDAMEAEAEPVACETGAFAPESGDMVFFIADDEEAMAGDGPVDFDVMAATIAPTDENVATAEESVADILVEEADRPVALETTPFPADDSSSHSAPAEMGIWSRFWSRMRPGETPALAPAPKKPEQRALADAEESMGHETAGEEPSGQFGQVMDELQDSSVPEAVSGSEGEVVEPSAAIAEDFEPAELGDVSADYIPDSAPDAYETPAALLREIEDDKTMLLEAQRAIKALEALESEAEMEPVAEEHDAPASKETPATESVEAPVSEDPAATDPDPEASDVEECATEEPVAEEPVTEESIVEAPVAEGSAVEEPVGEELVAERPVVEEPVVEAPVSENAMGAEQLFDEPSTESSDKKTSRRERRRRERAQKKKEKREKKTSSSLELPEIILTRSEDTETMMPEAEASEMEVANRDASAVARLSEPSAENTNIMENGELSMPEAGEQGAGESMMSLITPADIIGDAAGEEPLADEPAAFVEEEMETASEEPVMAGANDPLQMPQAGDESLSGAEPVAESGFESFEDGIQEELIGEHGVADDSPEADFHASEEALADESEEEAVLSDSDESAVKFESNVSSEGEDHLMIVAGGGYDLTEMENLFLSFDNIEEPEGGISEPGGQESANNVILFHERFPVFAGDQLDAEDYEEEDESFFQPVLRVLPPVETDETVQDEMGVEAGEPEAEAVESPAAEAENENAAEDVLPESEPSAVEEVAEESPIEPAAEEQFVAAAAELPSGEVVEEAAESVDAPVGDVLTPATRLCLLRAFGGRPDDGEAPMGEPVELFEDEHLIMTLEPEKDSATEMLEREAAVRAEMEQEYQVRLDEFAGRILQVQAATAASEARVREKKAEIEAKDAIVAELQNRLTADEKKQQALNRSLDDARREIGARQAEIERLKGVQEEHGRLYGEFEDLRKAYNEVVTDVMPGLQDERDDLAMTVERQCQKEKKLRGSLASSRRRLAVGYALGAAACIMLVALPVANWLKSGDDSRALARDHQMVSELNENYNNEVNRVIELQKAVVELEREVENKNAELASLQGRNRDTARSGQQNRSNIAVFPPPDSGQRGTPTRTSTMALQATDLPSGQRRVNEIRDPAGSIESLMAQNQINNAQNAPRMAQGNSNQRIPVSSVATRERPQAGATNGLRPGAAPANGMRPPQAQARVQSPPPSAGRAAPGQAQQRGQSRTSRRDEVLAQVKKGEGVAQVVYRVLGTRDPEVIAWVIRENNIKSDRRGNPIIQPDQQLRLPKDGNGGQSASAASRR